MKTIKDLMNLKGRVALVTGGAGHLGSVMAETLAEAGCNLIIVDTNKAAVKMIAGDLEKKFKALTDGMVLDITDEKVVADLPAALEKKFRRLDILINCAALVGTSHLKGWAVPFDKQDIGTWRKALEVNLTAVFSLSQSLHPLIKKSGHGSIINISSIYGINGPDMTLYEGSELGNPAAYSASKGGLLQLTRWLSTVLAPEVRVNAITLGGVFRNHQEPFLTRYKNRTPLKRMATEEDIKGAVLYLASDLSNYVTGQNLVVDGGWTAW